MSVDREQLTVLKESFWEVNEVNIFQPAPAEEVARRADAEAKTEAEKERVRAERKAKVDDTIKSWVGKSTVAAESDKATMYGPINSPEEFFALVGTESVADYMYRELKDSGSSHTWDAYHSSRPYNRGRGHGVMQDWYVIVPKANPNDKYVLTVTPKENNKIEVWDKREELVKPEKVKQLAADLGIQLPGVIESSVNEVNIFQPAPADEIKKRAEAEEKQRQELIAGVDDRIKSMAGKSTVAFKNDKAIVYGSVETPEEFLALVGVDSVWNYLYRDLMDGENRNWEHYHSTTGRGEMQKWYVLVPLEDPENKYVVTVDGSHAIVVWDKEENPLKPSVALKLMSDLGIPVSEKDLSRY